MPRAAQRRVTAKNRVACVILAAGKGTRMRSARSKVLHHLLGREMLAYPVARAIEVGADPVVAVLGHQDAEVRAALDARFGAGRVRCVHQAEQLGTGHAVRLALPALRGFDGVVAILYGDVPLLRRETLAELAGIARRYACLSMVVATPPDATGYGRVVRDEREHVLRVVEHKDATPEELAVTEVNAGIYAAPAAFLRDAVAGLGARNAAGEYYLTDIVAHAARTVGVSTVEASFVDVAGINNRLQLAEAERMLRLRLNRLWMRHATLHDPDSTDIEPDVEVGVDVEIGRGVALRGRTRVHRGARVDEGCILTDVEVGAGAHIKPYTVATEAVIGVGAQVGPFAHLRPGSDLGPDVHVGNFVELKKTRLGRGSKANHLTYLGDATVGEKVNIGAGTITCNYNGFEKLPTVIEDGAFIGSDTQLVAPVRVGRRAVVAAGTTVTADVPAGALAVSRVPQKAVAGYADKLAARYRAARGDKPGARAAVPAPARRLRKKGKS